MLGVEAQTVSQEILVVGETPNVGELVAQLRSVGLSTSMASTTLDIYGLLQWTRLRPTMIVAYLPHADDLRTELVVEILAHEQLTGLPTVFIGAERTDMSAFCGPCCSLPEWVSIDTVAHIVSRLAET
jgi:hypothetical protein